MKTLNFLIQVSNTAVFKNRQIFGLSLSILRTVKLNAGARGLYQGLSPNFVGASLSWGFYFLWLVVGVVTDFRFLLDLLDWLGIR